MLVAFLLPAVPDASIHKVWTSKAALELMLLSLEDSPALPLACLWFPFPNYSRKGIFSLSLQMEEDFLVIFFYTSHVTSHALLLLGDFL